MKTKILLCILPIILLIACTREYRPTESYTLTNNLNENYIVEYTEKSGFPDTFVDIVIYNSEKKIADYSPGDYKDIETLKPQKIIFLCNTDDYELYYIGNENIDDILINGENDLGFNNNKANIHTKFIDYARETQEDRYFKLAEDLKNYYTKPQLIDKFEKCGYDYTAVMYLYDLAS